MSALSPEAIADILDAHERWLRGEETGRRATLMGASLSGANLSGASLSDATLSGATLRGADLRDANLRGADLSGANLFSADLRGANLSRADLRDANLRGANLSRADLLSADLSGANLRGADLRGALLPPLLAEPPAGDIIVYKQCREGVVTLRVPAAARRTGSLVGRKCRAEYAVVTALPKRCEVATSRRDPDFAYCLGKTVRPEGDDYDDDIRIECAPGIHFFLTREEAEKYA